MLEELLTASQYFRHNSPEAEYMYSTASVAQQAYPLATSLSLCFFFINSNSLELVK